MRDLTQFATDAYPLHASGLRNLVSCPWKVVVGFLSAPSDESGAAADTGSAVHAAAAAFHHGKEAAACLSIMGSRIREYPQADLKEAAALFLAYAADPRNRSARVVLVEQEVKFTISPASHDKTQAPIQVVGTVDQVRELDDGSLAALDIKTSKKDPVDLLNNHAMQVAAYMVGASYLLGRPVKRGCLITPRKYRPDGTGPAFWWYPWTLDDTAAVLEAVRNVVAAVRAGNVWHVAGEQCTWCPFRTPDACMPRLTQLRASLPSPTA